MGFRYEYYFVETGSTRKNCSEVNNEIWIDVGNNICPGVFDHHGGLKDYASTVDVLTHEIDLLEATRESLNEEQPVYIKMHKNPDTDALFACFYLCFFLNNGREEYLDKLVKSNAGQVIIKYVNDIDAGKNKSIEKLTLYKLISNLDAPQVRRKWNIPEEDELSGELSARIVEQAQKWIEKAVEIAEEYGNKLYFGDFPIDRNDKIGKLINDVLSERDKLSYERDKRNGIVEIKDILLPTKEGKVESVKAAIWKDLPYGGASSYIFARQEGAVVTFVPHKRYGDIAAMVSLNKDIGAVGKYRLDEVGEMYELYEQIYEKRHYEETGELRRDYSHSRSDARSQYFSQKPFSLTADPWYVSSLDDVVDGPGKKGSLLPIPLMIEVLENITEQVKKTYIVDYDLKNAASKYKVSYESSKKSGICSWMRETQKTIDVTLNNGGHLDKYPFVIVQVDASIIAHNYEILDAIYMNLLNKAYLEAGTIDVLRMDYRTHLYVNQNCAVLFVATSLEEETNKQMSGLLDMTDAAKIEHSKIVEIFGKILLQREKMKEIGACLKDFKKNARDLNKKNEELIEILAGAQADKCLDNQAEIDAFDFIYESLNIGELKDSVTETMNLVSEYTKEKTYANLNFLSVITIPFILFSTFFQMGVLHFAPLLDLENRNYLLGSLIPWIISLILIVICTIKLYRGRKK